MDQFTHYDSDGDGQISPSEFVDLITEIRECYLQRVYIQCLYYLQLHAKGGREFEYPQQTNFTDEHLNVGSQVITIKAELAPLDASTMSVFAHEDPTNVFQ